MLNWLYKQIIAMEEQMISREQPASPGDRTTLTFPITHASPVHYHVLAAQSRRRGHRKAQRPKYKGRVVVKRIAQSSGPHLYPPETS